MATKNATAAPEGAPDMGLPPGMPGTEGFQPDDQLSAQMANMMANSTGQVASDIDDFITGTNLSGVSDGGDFAVLTDGAEYEFWIKTLKPGKSGAGNKKLTLILQVTEDYEEAGSVIPDNITFTEAALWRWKSLLKVTDMVDSAGNFIGTSYTDLKGCKVKGKVVNEPGFRDATKTVSKIDGAFMVPDGGAGQRRPVGNDAAPAGAPSSLPPGL